MKYFFVLGRNPELSIAELICFFEKEDNKIINLENKKNAVVIELENEILGKIIDKFGGIVCFGEVLANGSVKEIIDKLGKKGIYSGAKNKINYSIFNYVEEDDFYDISEYLKSRFKEEKLKATEKNLRGLIKMQNKEYIEIIPSKNSLDEVYFIFSFDEKNNFKEKEICFGRIIEFYNAEKIEKRDMSKPVRRQELSISPRLAKIMINLSGIKLREGEILLDAFCGIGVILQEALLQEINVVGIDNDAEALEGCRQNLKWFKFNEKNYQLVNADSRNVKIFNASVLVSEPYLGETFRKVPADQKARAEISRAENLMISVLNNLKPRIKGRFVFTLPIIKTMNRDIFCNKDKILKNTGLKLVNFSNTIDLKNPFIEIREGKITGREIFVLEH